MHPQARRRVQAGPGLLPIEEKPAPHAAGLAVPVGDSFPQVRSAGLAAHQYGRQAAAEHTSKTCYS